MEDPKIKHQGLSTTFKGIRHGISSPGQEVWQFRGIKYANIPSRWKQSIPNESFLPEVNASSFGAQCPQLGMAFRFEDVLVNAPPGVVSKAPDTWDEFECLTLNITVPAGANAKSNLPVMLFVHGGGGFSGSNADWPSDPGSLVKTSMAIGKPVVAVAINYRLAVFGYLGSEELIKEYGVTNGGNFAPRDIHTGISWVSKHVSSFGGNPSNITLYGESHGACAIDAQLHSNLQPLFSRCIMQSQTLGAPLFTNPQTIAEKSECYNAMKSYLGVTTLAELTAVPYTDLLTAYTKSDPRNSIGDMPMLDDIFLSLGWETHFSSNCPVIIGTVGAERMVIKVALSGIPPTIPRPTTASLIATLSTTLGEANTTAIMTAYSITTHSPASYTADSMLDLIEDLAYYIPARDLAARCRAHGLPVTEYSFEQPSPFTGPCQGTATHGLDVAYMHGPPELFAAVKNPEAERKIQMALQESWVRFAYGVIHDPEDWKKGDVRIFGPKGEIRDVSEDTLWRGYRRAEKWGGLETLRGDERIALLAAVFTFVAEMVGNGPPPEEA